MQFCTYKPTWFLRYGHLHQHEPCSARYGRRSGPVAHHATMHCPQCSAAYCMQRASIAMPGALIGTILKCGSRRLAWRGRVARTRTDSTCAYAHSRCAQLSMLSGTALAGHGAKYRCWQNTAAHTRGKAIVRPRHYDTQHCTIVGCRHCTQRLPRVLQGCRDCVGIRLVLAKELTPKCTALCHAVLGCTCCSTVLLVV